MHFLAVAEFTLWVGMFRSNVCDGFMKQHGIVVVNIIAITPYSYSASVHANSTGIVLGLALKWVLNVRVHVYGQIQSVSCVCYSSTHVIRPNDPLDNLSPYHVGNPMPYRCHCQGIALSDWLYFDNLVGFMEIPNISLWGSWCPGEGKRCTPHGQHHFTSAGSQFALRGFEEQRFCLNTTWPVNI